MPAGPAFPSTRPDGRPHTRPVWGIWHDAAFSFSTGSLAARNLAHNRHIIDRGSIFQGTTTRWRF